MKNRVQSLQKKARHHLRKLGEFRGIRKQPFGTYQKSVRRLYDGPRGAVLKFSSMISLHEPLMGKLFHSGRFKAGRYKRILDVGSGAGQIIRHLLATSSLDTEVVGFDLSWQMLKRARERLNSNRPVFVAADMRALPFRDESFDCVTCGYVLEYLPDPQDGLREFARVLRPGGTILLLATEDSFSGLMTSHTWKCRTFNRDELKLAAEAIGLRWGKVHWFTRLHEVFKLGGILVELEKPEE